MQYKMYQIVLPFSTKEAMLEWLDDMRAQGLAGEHTGLRLLHADMDPLPYNSRYILDNPSVSPGHYLRRSEVVSERTSLGLGVRVPPH